jgi:hypothetical protein
MFDSRTRRSVDAMNQRNVTFTDGSISASDRTVASDRLSGLDRRFPATDMPIWLMLVLVALGLPRTVLADLDIVAPEDSLLYYILALTPFAVWLVVAILRRSRRPFRDFLVLGILYGVSLLVVHQSLWDLGPSLGYHPPQSAVDFADQFSPAWQQFAQRTYTSGVAMLIGVGTGLVVAVTAIGSHAWRSSRARRAGLGRAQ